MTDMERRTQQQNVQLRAAGDAGGLGVLFGYALTFNSLSRDLGGFLEEVAPGAVDLATTERVIARWNHDSNGLLGTTDAGTLRLLIDDTGVQYEVDLPDTSTGRDMAVLAVRGDIKFSSFAFTVLPGGDTWRLNESDQLIRTLTAIQLFDVAPVADPAYWGSTAGVRTMDTAHIRAGLTEPPAPDAAPLHLELELARHLAS